MDLVFHAGILEPLGARLARIGRGSFSTTYLEVGGEGRVFSLTRSPGHGKDAVEAAGAELSLNPHLPRARKVGDLAGGGEVYAAPFYRTPIREREHPVAWAQHLVLRRAVHGALVESDLRSTRNYLLNYRAAVSVEAAAVRREVPAALAEALWAVVRAAGARSLDYALEVYPSDLGVDAEGRLVLLDVVFDERVLRRRRRARAGRASLRA